MKYAWPYAPSCMLKGTGSSERSGRGGHMVCSVRAVNCCGQGRKTAAAAAATPPAAAGITVARAHPGGPLWPLIPCAG